MMPPFKKYFAELTVNTWLLAAASLFADVSTEMLYPVLPVFLTQTLGASAGIVGIIEGVADMVPMAERGRERIAENRSKSSAIADSRFENPVFQPYAVDLASRPKIPE